MSDENIINTIITTTTIYSNNDDTVQSTSTSLPEFLKTTTIGIIETLTGITTIENDIDMSTITIPTTSSSSSSSSVTSIPTKSKILTGFEYSNFLLNYIDYSVILFMLICSTTIGLYYGFVKKSQNNTDEYLLGGRNMKILPIAVSLIASQLSANSIITMPSEIYSFGLHFLWTILALFPALIIYIFVVLPVYYNNNILNCYQYLEMRFDKKTRVLITYAFLFKIYFMIPLYIFIPALSFSQVTGLNVHLINVVICAICVFYTMFGGIKAVVWTDIMQAVIMFVAIAIVAVFAFLKIGSFEEIFIRASNGGRLWITNFSFDLTQRTSVWSNFLSSIIGWLGYVGLNQVCVQRIVSLPTIGHAKASLTIFTFGCFITLSICCFIGILMYSWYFECDPVKAGIVSKADKLVPFFVQDIVGKVTGMPGLFISAVFSASLSTMSACLNSLAGVIYFDIIRPHINHTEEKANLIMKVIVVLNGVYCILGGFVAEQFDSLLQIVFTIIGVTQGCVGGVFLIGMLIPRVHAKAIFIAAIISFAAMFTIALGSTIQIRAGVWKYHPLETSVENCDRILNITNVVSSQNLTKTIYKNENDNMEFSIFRISFYWYTFIGAVIVLVVSLPLSFILEKSDKNEADINLFPPIIHRLIKRKEIDDKTIEITKL